MIKLTPFSGRGRKYLSYLDKVYGKNPALEANNFKGREFHKAVRSGWLFLKDLDSVPVLVKLISIKKVKIAYKSGNRIDDGILVKYQIKSPIIQGGEDGLIDFLEESETSERAYVSSSVWGYQHGADRFELLEFV